MKIAFVARPTLYTQKGGDTVQVLNTAAALQRQGVTVDIFLSDEKINYNNYNLLHFFNIIDCEDLLGHAVKTNIPFLISTIYVDYSEYDKLHRKDFIGFISRFLSYNQVEYLKTLAKFVLKGEKVSTYKYFFKGHSGSIRFLLKKAACLLPNSDNEYKRITSAYGIKKKYFFIPNAIDPALFIKINNINRDIVLCVARIEGRKNQLNLIKAINGTNLKLVLIGAISANQKSYYNQCLAEAGENVTFINEISQPDLLKYYAKTKVHILPSWFETTGLSSLEAGVMGCNLVVADKGDVRDYFKDFVEYCDPGNIESIRSKIFKAWEQDTPTGLIEYIRDNFIWEKTAEKTLAAYNYVLNEKLVS